MPEINSPQPSSILVIDDKADLLTQIRQLLEGEGFEVATAQRGKAALRALDDEPRLVVLRIQRKSQDELDRGMVRPKPTFASAAARPERAAMERAAFSRIVTFVERAISKTSTQTLEQALGESGPSMAMADVLSEALLEDTSEGRWAQALLRGAQVKRELLETAGGSLSVNQVGALLGISRAAVDKRRRQRALLGLKLPSGDIAYPAAQFSKSDVLPGLQEVLGSFRIQDPWMQLEVLLARDQSLSGRTLFEALADRDVEVVKSRVSSFGDQGL